MESLPQQIVNGLIVGSTYAVVALGFALMFSVMRVINLAHPDMFMVSMFAGLVIVRSFSDSLLVVIIGAALLVALLGLVLERTVLRPLRRQDILMPMIATAGVSLAIEHTVQRIFGPDQLPFPQILPFFRIGGEAISFSSKELVNFGAAILVMVVVSFYIRRTSWGLKTRAVAERPDVAATFGVNVNRVAQLTVGLSAALAGIAGVTIALLYGSAGVFIGLLYGLKSFVCMLVAGDRYIEGIMLVGLALGVLEALTGAYVSSNYRDAVAFGVLIVVLYLRPEGLFGSYSS